MTRTARQTLLRVTLGLTLIVAAGALAPPRTSGDGVDADPLSRSLAPLGPIKAVISSMLWTDLLRQGQLGRTERAQVVAEALLRLHPDLGAVREYLSFEFAVTQATRAPDRLRHRVAVIRGLQVLQEGLEREGGEELSGPLARLLTARSLVDPWFGAVVEQYWSESPEEMAIDVLRHATDSPDDRLLLASLLVRRGLREVEVRSDPWRARRDLEEADALLQSIGENSEERQVIEALRDSLEEESL